MKRLVHSKISSKFSSPDYLAFVHTFGCAIAGVGAHVCAGNVEAHHALYKSHEGSDLDAVPLCEAAHLQWHRIGEEAFCDLHGIDEGEIQRNLLHYYVQSIDRGDKPQVKAEAKKLARGKQIQPLSERRKFVPISERNLGG